MQFNGMDVSHFQGVIDWKKVKNTNLDFVFIKATEGTAYKYVDHFKTNVPLALGVGLGVGAYHFSSFSTIPEAITQAQYFYSIIKDFKLTYPVVLDIETNDQKVSKKQLTDSAIAFLEFLENKGYFVMWYSDDYFIDNNLDVSRLSAYSKWVASYGKKPTNNYDIWQFSDKGSVDGVNGLVDLNTSYRDFAQEIQAKSYKAPELFKYCIKSGETLSKIAITFKTSVDYLLKINPAISNPNKIYVGQIIQVPKK